MSQPARSKSSQNSNWLASYRAKQTGQWRASQSRGVCALATSGRSQSFKIGAQIFEPARTRRRSLGSPALSGSLSGGFGDKPANCDSCEAANLLAGWLVRSFARSLQSGCQATSSFASCWQAHLSAGPAALARLARETSALEPARRSRGPAGYVDRRARRASGLSQPETLPLLLFLLLFWLSLVGGAQLMVGPDSRIQAGAKRARPKRVSWAAHVSLGSRLTGGAKCARQQAQTGCPPLARAKAPTAHVGERRGRTCPAAAKCV